MKSYRIIIKVSDVGGIYNANDSDEACKIAQSLCDDVYARLYGKCSVEVEYVDEVTT